MRGSETLLPRLRMLSLSQTRKASRFLLATLYDRRQSFFSNVASKSCIADQAGDSSYFSSVVRYGGPQPTTLWRYVCRTYAGVFKSSADGLPTKSGNRSFD